MNIQNTKSISQDRLKILVYGAPGSGKTSLARTLKEKVLIISAEAGLLSLHDYDIDVIDITVNDEGKPIPRDMRLQRLGEALEFASKKESQQKYRWLFIDSLTEIGQNLSEAMQKVYADPKDALKMWGEYSKKMTSLVKSFRDLPSYNVVFTALDSEDTDDTGRRYMRVSLQGKIGKQIPAFFDEVLWMHVDREKNERALLCSPRENVVAKDRSGRLSNLELPNLQLIADKIRGQSTETKTTKTGATK